MSWAKTHVERLLLGDTVALRPRGNSMRPLIESGSLVTVEPLPPHLMPAVGDIVLCKVKGMVYLHRVLAREGRRFQIGNAKGHINGWTTREQLFGRVIGIDQ